MELLKKLSRAAGRAFTLPILLYQKLISPLFPATCKYHPTCSSYAIEAYRRHGVFMGTLLTVWRLLRCNPWSLGGIDHVPEVVTPQYFIPKNLRKK